MERKKKITNYTVLMDNKLGEGAFGKVYVGEQDNTNLKVAIKVLEKKAVDSDEYIKSALFSEIQVLKCLKSPNIVGFLDVMESVNYYYIIQEFCDGGELRKFMKKKGKIPEKEAIILLMQICNGFVELIKQGVMHRDLKPENVLIHQGILKIADFGFSKKGQSLKKVAARTMVGTPLYMSLQVLKNKPYSSKCDIWSLGFIFYQMLFARTPWTGNSQYQLIKNIEKQPLSFPHQISQVTKDFIRKSVALDEKDRHSWDELLRHPIFKGYFSSKDKQYQNKYKAIMNHIRYQVKEKNIDLQQIFIKMGYSKATPMAYQSFYGLMAGIDSELTQQQIKYIFNKINQSGSGSITYDEFDRTINNFSIPKSTIKGHPPKNTVQNPQNNFMNQNDPNSFKKQVNLKVSNAFHKLIISLSNQQNTLFSVFDYYKLTQKGAININDFEVLMMALDPSFTKQQIQIGFSSFDKTGNKNVSLLDFINYFANVTGYTPVKTQPAFIRSNSMKSDTSQAFSTSLIPEVFPKDQQLYGQQGYTQQQYDQQYYQSSQQQYLQQQQQYVQQQHSQQQQYSQQQYPQQYAQQQYGQQYQQAGTSQGQYDYNNGYGYVQDPYAQGYKY